MSDLDAFRARPPPRDAAFVEPWARELEPIRSYLLHVVVATWLALSLFVAICIGVAIGGMRAMNVEPPVPGWLLLVGALTGVIAATFPVWLVARFVRKRRDRARALYGKGEIVDAAIFKTWSQARMIHNRGIHTYWAANLRFELADGARFVALPLRAMNDPYVVGAKWAVLYERSSRHVLAFPLQGADAGRAIVLRAG